MKSHYCPILEKAKKEFPVQNGNITDFPTLDFSLAIEQ